MKNFKAFLTVVVSLALMLVPATLSSADHGGITITGVASANHIFRAYQLFTGDVYEDRLSNIAWGSGVDGDGLLIALKADGMVGSYFEGCEKAADAAVVVSEHAEDSDFLIRFHGIAADYVTTPSQTAGTGSADGDFYTYRLLGLSDGYYLVTDTGAAENDANSLYMTRLLNGEPVTIAVKAVYPTVDKNMIGGSTDKGTSASAGDTVTFELTGTIPEDLSGYETYDYIFHDSMSSGLSFAYPLNLTVTASNGTADFDHAIDEQNLTVTLKNAKELAGGIVRVRYDALMNEGAQSGIAEKNSVYLEYTHDPNTNEHGKTTEHKVYVYDFGLTVYKEDSENQPLAGAGFTLYKKDTEGSWQEVKDYEGKEMTTFCFENLGEGTYRLAETTTPKGYNTIEDIEFQILATYSADGTISALATDHPDIAVNGCSGFTAKIVNKPGAILPGFGGAGVFLFYLAGAALVVTAVFLMKKKKGSSAENVGKGQ